MSADTAAPQKDVYRHARALLVKHWIDIGRITIVFSDGTLQINGTFVRLPGVTSQLTPAVVDNMIRDLQRIQGIDRVEASFDNWTQDGDRGDWQPVVSKESDYRSSPPPKA